MPELLAGHGRLLEAFRSGRGFTYDAMGEDNVCATCRCADCFPQLLPACRIHGETMSLHSKGAAWRQLQLRPAARAVCEAVASPAAP